MQLLHHSAVSHHQSLLTLVQLCHKVFFWQLEKSRLVLRADLKHEAIKFCICVLYGCNFSTLWL